MNCRDYPTFASLRAPRSGLKQSYNSTQRSFLWQGGFVRPCSFDYDVYEYSINGGEPKPLPEGIGTIEIEVE